jgi:hypothetical protein
MKLVFEGPTWKKKRGKLMIETLTQALEQLDLRPGESRQLRANGRKFVIRCVQDEETSRFDDAVMLEPWVEFPRPNPIGTLIVRPGKLPVPDPPAIPPDNEGSAT